MPRSARRCNGRDGDEHSRRPEARNEAHHEHCEDISDVVRYAVANDVQRHLTECKGRGAVRPRAHALSIAKSVGRMGAYVNPMHIIEFALRPRGMPHVSEGVSGTLRHVCAACLLGALRVIVRLYDSMRWGYSSRGYHVRANIPGPASF